VPRLRPHGLWALLLLFAPVFAPVWVSAQSPVEMTIKREQLKSQLLPPFLHAITPEIEEQIKTQMLELDQGFTRTQFVEIPLASLLKDRKSEFMKMVRDDAQLKSDWTQFLESLNDLSVRISFKLKVLPHAKSINVKFEPTDNKQSLIQFEGKLIAQPEIQILEISGLEILEVDPDSGRGTTFPMPTEDTRLKAPASLKFDRPADFVLEGTLTENFGTKDSKRIFKLDLSQWNSTFKDVLISEPDSQALVSEFLQEHRFYSFVRTLMQTRTFGGLLGNDIDSNSSLIEREIKAQLDARRETVIVWMERGINGELIPHLHADLPEVRERIERARTEKRLVLEAVSQIPLSLEKINVNVDFENKKASAYLEPHPEFEAIFQIKTFELPPDWMGTVGDPVLKQIISQLYGKNLLQGKDVQARVKVQTREFEDDLWLPSKGGSLEVPLVFSDGTPRIDSSRLKVDLPFLDDVKIADVALRWNEASEIHLSPQSPKPLNQQLLLQLDKIVEAHQFVLGDEFLNNFEGTLLTEIERQVEQIQGAKLPAFAGDMGYSYKVTGFDIGAEGDMKCQVRPGRGPRPPVGYSFIPQGVGFDLLKTNSLFDFECEVQLPKTIDLSLSKIGSAQGSVASIDFSLVAERSELQRVKLKMKLVRDPKLGSLVMVPETWNLEEVLQNYKIPESGNGAPVIRGVAPAGMKGTLSTSARVPALLWSYVIGPRVDLGAVGNAAVSAGTWALAAKAWSLEQEEVESMLRSAVKDSIKDIQRELPETLFEELNGDLVRRRKLKEQGEMSDQAWEAIRRNPFGSQHIEFIDPETVNLGLMGEAEGRVLSQLEKVQEDLPWDESVGSFVIDESGLTVRQLAEREVIREARDTIEGTGGIRPIAEIVSNPRLENLSQKVKTEGLDYVRRSVSDSAGPLEEAVVDYLRKPSDEPNPNGDLVASPLESLEDVLSQRIFEMATIRSSIQTDAITLPDFCGVSLVPDVHNQTDQVLTMIVDMEGREKRPVVGAQRSERAPNFHQLFEMADEEGMIPVTVSTYLLERIAKNPDNLARVTKLIRDEAVKQPGIREEDFNLELRDPKVRMTAEGTPVLRIGVKIEQDPSFFQNVTGVLGLLPDALLSLITGEDVKAFQTITGLPGWLIDQASRPVTDIDGYMELEIPINLSVGDYVQSGSGKHDGHYLVAWADPDQLKIKNKEGWSSVFGSMAKDQVKKNANEFHRALRFDQPLAIPGYEDMMTFEVGKTIGPKSSKRRTVEGIPSVLERDAGPDGLYRGSLVFKLRPVINPEYQAWPSITVYNPKRKVEVPR
jgi:hypothetical protein